MGPCHFCSTPGPKRAGKDDGLVEDLHACEQCWKLLQNPATGLQLIRGDLSVELRGKVKKAAAEPMINKFMEKISTWKPQGPTS